jgi:hypothetical protein
MNPAEISFAEKIRLHRAHIAAVPAALALAKGLTVDFDGSQMVDGEPPRDGLTCAALRTLVTEVERLQELVKQQSKDARDADREFSREAREIASEARWQAQNEADGVPYGTY